MYHLLMGMSLFNNLKREANMKFIFQVQRSIAEYCQMCQQLGEAKYGVKTHRNIPLDTYEIKMFHGKKEKWAVLCADCLAKAHLSDEVDEVQEPDGSPFDKSKYFFLREPNHEHK